MTNPITPPPRFEIRKLGPEHLEWAKAIISHSNVFHSPVWAKIYPENQTERFYTTYDGATHLVKHQIDSGLSYGVFDKEYVFKNPESAQTGGAVYFESQEGRDPTLTGSEVLAQMDFPLASIALAFDAADPMDMTRVAPIFQALPDFATFAPRLDARDARDKSTWEAKGPRELLKRMGTATRVDYMNVGITKTMAHWLMFDAAGKGFRGINIECYHDAVRHIWTNPPEPFRADLVAVFGVDEYEVEKDGEVLKPYGHVTQALSKVYVYLK
ncbi:hypothetical protein BJY01DRAFT_226598 [Aspergillus pseudoustus]|uniref:EthD domain-containing protein n=1 Tax=Aspergillus pseudoustus TaxID=1810923 RepID=A0ABR4IUZ4_9EURO